MEVPDRRQWDVGKLAVNRITWRGVTGNIVLHPIFWNSDRRRGFHRLDCQMPNHPRDVNQFFLRVAKASFIGIEKLKHAMGPGQGFGGGAIPFHREF